MSRLYIHGYDEAEGAHRARLPAVPLPGLSAAVQRADRPPRSTILQYPTDIVLLAVLWRLRYKLGFRDVAELLLQRGFEVSHETIRAWEVRFAPLLDNALAESVIGLYKAELVERKGPWRGLDDLEYATLEWVDWFNHRRLFSAIGYVPPAEYEANLYRGTVPAEAGTQ